MARMVPPRSPDRAVRSDASRNRERLVRAAVAAYHRDGVGMTLTAVAAEAGVGIGTLYRHFGTREELLDELTLRSFEQLLGWIGEAAAIEAGGVMINDSSDYRFDAMPFGGFKHGSMGREGVRFAYEDMTQSKVVCINRV